MGCWEIIDIEDVPPGQNLIECKWVFKVKYRGTGTPDGGMIYDKHRARIVAKGFQQRKGIDFHESFSPMIVLIQKIECVRWQSCHFTWGFLWINCSVWIHMLYSLY